MLNSFPRSVRASAPRCRISTTRWSRSRSYRRIWTEGEQYIKVRVGSVALNCGLAAKSFQNERGPRCGRACSLESGRAARREQQALRALITVLHHSPLYPWLRTEAVMISPTRAPACAHPYEREVSCSSSDGFVVPSEVAAYPCSQRDRQIALS